MPPIRFYSLWAINAPMDEARLLRQLDDLRDDGFDGVVFHPRFYPDEPPYMSEDYLRMVSRIILRAKEIGLQFWIYDENGWPSGTVGGELLRRHPDCAATILVLRPGKADDAWHSFQHQGRDWHLKRVTTDCIDYLNPTACDRFLELVHERYRKELEPAAWAHVEAFFTDEPEFGLGIEIDRVSAHGAIMWSDGLDAHYRQEMGRDVRDDLPALFLGSEDGSHERLRIRFWEFLTDALCAGFFAPYLAWCRREGKLLTGHLKGDEHPLFQVMMNGSCHQIFQHMDIPGIDPLERFPSCDYFARQVASAAWQFGHGRAMAEVIGGGGWGCTPGDLERFLLWLSNHGSTDLVIHINQYRLMSHAIRDWPPSHPRGVNWRPAYAEVLQRVRRQTDASAAAHADLLVIAPYRGIMAGYEPWSLRQSNIHNCATYPDTAAGRLNDSFLSLLERLPASHHFADERSLEQHGQLDGAKLRLGSHTYTHILLADGCRLDAAGETLLQAFREAGGYVLSGADLPGPEKASQSEPASGRNPIKWLEVEPAPNHLLLEPRQDDGGEWSCGFELVDRVDGCSLFFADGVTEAVLDGGSLSVIPADDGSTARLPSLSQGQHTLRFKLPAEDAGPLFVWLQGDFRITSQSDWHDQSPGMVRTAGPWIVTADTECSPEAERVTAGWPFARHPTRMRGTFTTDRLAACRRLLLHGIAADAARVELDGADLGWAWGPDWSIELPTDLQAGEHALLLSLIPSTFNHYGPHHHLDGDRHLTSPDQFTGRKNFADHPQAPAITHDGQWRFRPLHGPSTVSLQ